MFKGNSYSKLKTCVVSSKVKQDASERGRDHGSILLLRVLLIAEMVYDLKEDCNKSKMPNVNPTATTKRKQGSININDKCGSLYPLVVRDCVLTNGYKCGFSFDGDGDRVGAR